MFRPVMIIGLLSSVIIGRSTGDSNLLMLYKVKTQTENINGHGPIPESFSYDSLGRQVLDSCGDKIMSRRISYLGDTVRELLAFDGFRRHHDKILGLRGCVERSLDGNEHWSFDDEGFCTYVTWPGHTNIFTINDGDVMSVASKEGDSSTIKTYTYYPEKDLRDYGVDYMGKNCIHLRRYKIINHLDTVAYQYTFDSLGRVITQTWINKKTKDTSFATFTYMQ